MGRTLPKNDDEGEELILGANTDTLIQKIEYKSTHYIINLDEDITEPSYYRSIIYTLKTAGPNDLVIFNINSPGGRVSSCVQICDAISNTQAHTIANLYDAHSAAGVIAFHCKELRLTEFSNLMIHSISFGSAGSCDSVKDQADFMHTQNKKLLKAAFEGFLTLKEIDDVIKGKEMWFDAVALNSRLQAQIKYRNKKTLPTKSENSCSKPKSKSTKKQPK